MFAYKKKVVPLQRQTKNDSVHVTLGYGVMVTQQILVLFFLVRIQVAQHKKAIQYFESLFLYVFYLYVSFKIQSIKTTVCIG